MMMWKKMLLYHWNLLNFKMSKVSLYVILVKYSLLQLEQNESAVSYYVPIPNVSLFL